MWMDGQDIERAATVMGRYAPDALPYARFLRDWRDEVARAGGRWDGASPGAASARDLMILLHRAGRAVRLRGTMPSDGEFRASLDPIKAAALRFGLTAPDIEEPVAAPPMR